MLAKCKTHDDSEQEKILDERRKQLQNVKLIHGPTVNCNRKSDENSTSTNAEQNNDGNVTPEDAQKNIGENPKDPDEKLTSDEKRIKELNTAVSDQKEIIGILQ